MTRYCPYCQAPLVEIRLGVRLSELKARIFDCVQAGGSTGVASDDLYGVVYNNHPRGRWGRDERPQHQALAVHIVQINELIEDQGYKIVGGRSGSAHTSYRLKNLNGGR